MHSFLGLFNLLTALGPKKSGTVKILLPYGTGFFRYIPIKMPVMLCILELFLCGRLRVKVGGNIDSGRSKFVTVRRFSRAHSSSPVKSGSAVGVHSIGDVMKLSTPSPIGPSKMSIDGDVPLEKINVEPKNLLKVSVVGCVLQVA